MLPYYDEKPQEFTIEHWEMLIERMKANEIAKQYQQVTERIHDFNWLIDEFGMSQALWLFLMDD